MNKENNENIILEEYENEFLYEKNKSNLSIKFNRVAFVFFVFFIISIIFLIQLLHLGSLRLDIEEIKPINNKKDYRANIIDRNDNYLVKL